jgi:hypothetical protein
LKRELIERVEREAKEKRKELEFDLKFAREEVETITLKTN